MIASLLFCITHCTWCLFTADTSQLLQT